MPKPIALLFAILFAIPSAAQYPALPSETPDKFKEVTDSFDYIKRDVMIPMRDGVKLHTVVLVPKGAKGALRTLSRAGIAYTWESERDFAKASAAFRAALESLRQLRGRCSNPRPRFPRPFCRRPAWCARHPFKRVPFRPRRASTLSEAIPSHSSFPCNPGRTHRRPKQ